MARYLVTGGGGFIGSNIVRALVERGEFVRVLDNFSTGRRENLRPFAGEIELLEGDMRYYHVCRKAVNEIDFVLHQAALPSVPRSINDPLTSNDANINGCLNMLQASVEARVKRFVYASSSSVYGDTEVSPKHEGLPHNPKSPYAVSKVTQELYARVYHQLFGLETVGLRYFNVFGPRQDPNSQYSAVIPKFVHALRAGQAPTIFGDGTTSRDFTFVENNVQANLLACEAPNVGGKVYNIACGKNYSLNNLVQRLNEVLGTSIEPKYADERAGDIKHSLADITRAQDDLQYKVQVSFEEGLRLLVENFETVLPARSQA